MDRKAGQALLELVIWGGVVTALLVASASLLHAQWERARCAYLVFESAHAHLTGRLPPRASPGLPRISVQERPQSVRAEALCPPAHETVELPKLEAGPW